MCGIFIQTESLSLVENESIPDFLFQVAKRVRTNTDTEVQMVTSLKTRSANLSE